MNQLTNPAFIKDLFRHYQVKPKDYLGQNFLVDEIALDQIVEAGDLKKTDTVLEIGPGLGVLTQQLAQRAGKVVAVEKDAALLEILKFNLNDYKNVEVHHQDVLKFNIGQKIKGPYKVIANIPYYLTSHLFQHLLALENKPELIVFLVQKEVGERITSRPGDLSIIAVSVQLFAKPEIVSLVPKTSFWPQPKVDSVIVKITPHKTYPKIDEKNFFRILKVGFSAKRKQLHNNLSSGLKIDQAETKKWLIEKGLTENARAEDLSVENWIELSKLFYK